MISPFIIDSTAHEIAQFELESAFFAEWYCHYHTNQIISYQPQTGHVLAHDPNPQPILQGIEDFKINEYKICYTKNRIKVQHCIKCQNTPGPD